MPIRRSPNGVRHVRPQPGRDRPEWVVAINRNAWSQSVGTGGRNHPVRADRLTFASLESVAHPADRPVLAELRHIMAQSLPFDRQFRVVHRNGRVRTLAIHGEVLVDNDGKRSRAVGVLIDITHQTEAMLASHITTERLRTLVNSIGGSIWVTQSNGHMVDLVARVTRTEGTVS